MERRKFLGGLLAATAATTAAATSRIIGSEIVEAKIIVPDKETVEAITRPDILELKSTSSIMEEYEELKYARCDRGAWFGASQDQVAKLGRQYDAWLHQHLQVNRYFGIRHSSQNGDIQSAG